MHVQQGKSLPRAVLVSFLGDLSSPGPCFRCSAWRAWRSSACPSALPSHGRATPADHVPHRAVFVPPRCYNACCTTRAHCVARVKCSDSWLSGTVLGEYRAALSCLISLLAADKEASLAPRAARVSSWSCATTRG